MPTTTPALPILTLLLLAGCGAEAADPAPSKAGGAAAQPAAGPEEVVPSPEEAASEAAQEIDASNADEELEKLQQELGGG